MDISGKVQKMFSNDKVNVIGGDIQSGDWEYKGGTLWHAFDQLN